MNSDVETLDSYSKSEDFQDLVERQLEFFDELLAMSGKPIHSRPMLSSMLFVEKCIVGSDDKPPPGYLQHEWFGRILSITTRWYRKRFGEALLQSPGFFTPAVVHLFGTTFRIAVPHFPTAPADEPGTEVMYFAKELLSHEQPLDWVTPRIDLSGLSSAAADEVQEQVRNVSNLVRMMGWGLSFALLPRGLLQEQSQSIRGHFEKAVADICAGRLGAAIWECHLAVEISLKLFLAQRKVSPIPHTHDLASLMKRASDAGLPPASHTRIDVLPHHTVAVKHRYSEVPEPSLAEMMETYEMALRIAGYVSGHLDRHELAQRDKVYVQALPWHPSRKQASKLSKP